MSNSVLLIDDDESVTQSVGAYLERTGAEVFGAATGEAGLAAYERLQPDLVVVDLEIPDMPGPYLLERLVARTATVIVLTRPGDTEAGVRATQLGADHFLGKPVDLTHFATTLVRSLERLRLRREIERLRLRARGGSGLEALGESHQMKELARQIRLLAASEGAPLLVTGEVGTGKGWIARVVHDLGERRAGPFVEVGCAAHATAVLESVLFGHERRQGAFELADGGTVFLDEIVAASPELQGKLLRVLDTRTVRRLGGTRETTVDARLIAATSRDLPAAVKEGRFREDLYDRLSVLPLRVPAVRERGPEDRLTLLRRLVAELHTELPGSPAECAPEALDRLLVAPWPGNVREMRNALERALILARRAPRLGVEHLPQDLRKVVAPAPGGADLHFQRVSLAEVERQHIERTLRFHGGNRTRAALDLGISRATLINKIKVYALDL